MHQIRFTSLLPYPTSRFCNVNALTCSAPYLPLLCQVCTYNVCDYNLLVLISNYDYSTLHTKFISTVCVSFNISTICCTVWLSVVDLFWEQYPTMVDPQHNYSARYVSSVRPSLTMCTWQQFVYICAGLLESVNTPTHLIPGMYFYN